MQAPETGGWVLLEHPGPWGPHRAADNPLIPEPVRAALREHRLRVHLIRRNRRRHGPRTGPGAPVTCLLAYGGPEPFLRGGTLTGAGDLLDVDLAGLAAGTAPDWGEPVGEPVFLVCTHGKIDACCARNGRPVATALAALAPEHTWEISHVGGCRFAATAICLPYGLFYSRLTPADAAPLLDLTRRGQLLADRYRGRAGLTLAAQAADAHLRACLGVHGIDDVVPHGQRTLSCDVEEVVLVARGVAYRLVMRREPLPAVPVNCGAETRSAHFGYRVVEVARP